MPHKSWKVICDRETSLSFSQKVPESLVCLFRPAKAGKLTHRPELAAIAGRVYPSRIRELTGERDVKIKIDVGHIRGAIEPVDFFERNGFEIRFTLALMLQRRLQGLFFPAFFGLVFRRGFFGLLHRPGSFMKGGAVAVYGQKYSIVWILVDGFRGVNEGA